MAKSKRSSSKPGKRSQREAEVTKQTKKQLAAKRRISKQNRYIYIGLAVVAAIIILVLAVGVIQELVVKPATPVGRVNGTKIPKDDFEELLQLRRYTTHMQLGNLQNELQGMDTSDESNQFMLSFYQSQLDQLYASLSTLPETTLDTLIDSVLIQEKAEEAGIEVTDEDVVESINEDLQVAAGAQLEPQLAITGTQEIETPTPVPQNELDAILDNALTNMQLSRGQYQNIVKREMVRSEVQDLLASQVISEGLVVQVQLIQTGSEELATAAKERIEAGEEFTIVASEVSTDTMSVADGGDLGWVTPSQLGPRYGEELETAVTTAEAGTLATVQSGDRFFVYLVVDRDENGPLPAEVLSQSQATALTDWLEERKASPDVEIERLLEPEDIPPDPFEYLSSGLGP
jgi:parvulin-like peptidyl-prolyl isomerase